MGLLSRIKRKLFSRGSADYGEVRSHVLNEPYMPPPPAQQKPFAKEPFQGDFEKEPFAREPGSESEFGEPFTKEPPFPRNQDFPALGKDMEGPSQDFRREYDIMDRLNLIEAQLAAIRSQTETINERLKNMEARLTRRY